MSRKIVYPKKFRKVKRVFQPPTARKNALRDRLRNHLKFHPGDLQAENYLKKLSRDEKIRYSEFR